MRIAMILIRLFLKTPYYFFRIWWCSVNKKISYQRGYEVTRHVTIGANCDIDKCLIMNDTVVGEGSTLKYVILDKDVVVYPGAKLMGTPTNPLIIKRGDKV